MGRLLTFVYGLFALSATARATVQIFSHFDQAPVAYLLSLLAGLIYIAATFGLATRRRTLALVCVSIELVGVLAVGAASYVWPQAFPDATVWSHFGQGYGYVPLVLPFLGLAYLLRHPTPTPSGGAAAGG
jgi:cytochrome bd-type quinol oxidase subunit 2